MDWCIGVVACIGQESDAEIPGVFQGKDHDDPVANKSNGHVDFVFHAACLQLFSLSKEIIIPAWSKSLSVMDLP